jgi:hypothetical protein
MGGMEAGCRVQGLGRRVTCHGLGE